jgi:hypothetical protein
MRKNTQWSLLLTCVFAFAGGALSQQIFISKTAIAAADEIKAFFDQSGTKRLDLGVFNNSPIQDFYGEDGQPRLQFGTYTASGEKGLPLVSLSDNQGHIRLLLRLAGSNQSPVIIFKDSKGSDRILMGLALNDASEEPFLTYTDKTGSHTLFGGNTDTTH